VGESEFGGCTGLISHNNWFSCGLNLDRLSSESDRSAMLVSEVSELKQQVTTRDKLVMKLNTEMESVRQQMTDININYQAALQQYQLAQHAL